MRQSPSRIVAVSALVIASSVMHGCIIKEQLQEKSLNEIKVCIDNKRYDDASQKLKNDAWLYEDKDWGNLVMLCRVMDSCKAELAKPNPDIKKCRIVWEKRPNCGDFPWPMWFSDEDIVRAEKEIAEKKRLREIELSKPLTKGKLYSYKDDDSGIAYSYMSLDNDEIAIVSWGVPGHHEGWDVPKKTLKFPNKIGKYKVVMIMDYNRYPDFLKYPVGDDYQKQKEIVTAFLNNRNSFFDGIKTDERFVNASCSDAFDAIVIPEGVRTIGYEAFQFSKAKTVVFPSTLRHIACEAFMGSKLEKVEIPDAVTRIDEGSFKSCRDVVSVKIGAGVREIAEYAFAYLLNNRELIFAEGVETIGDNAFCNNENIMSIKLPKSVKTVGMKAFEDCENLKNVDIGGATEIGESAFNSCKIENLDLNNVVTIKKQAFYGNKTLKSVRLPDTVRFLGKEAFHACRELSEIDAGMSVCGIDITAVKNTQWWRNQGQGLICLGGSVLGYNAPRGAGPSSIIIPDGIKEIADEANLGDDGSSMTGKRSKLTEVELPDSVVYLGANAFCESSIQEITLPKGLKKIGRRAFRNTLLENVELPSVIEEIGDSAFENCKLKRVVIPGTISTISESMFEGNRNLESVVIVDGVTTIAKRAFANCEGLSAVEMASSVKEVDSSAFLSCTKIGSLMLPSDKFSVPALFGASSASITKIKVSEGSESVIQGFAAALPNLESVTIPATVKEIGSGAFLKCSKLKYIEFEGDEPSKIAANAFKGTPDDVVIYAKGNTTWSGDMIPSNGGENARKLERK